MLTKMLCTMQALRKFDRQLLGFITESALLHGVETRTSAPVQIGEEALTVAHAAPGAFPPNTF
jgi:uncharacterized FAD-dependent dehydrogenase